MLIFLSFIRLSEFLDSLSKPPLDTVNLSAKCDHKSALQKRGSVGGHICTFSSWWHISIYVWTPFPAHDTKLTHWLYLQTFAFVDDEQPALNWNWRLLPRWMVVTDSQEIYLHSNWQCSTLKEAECCLLLCCFKALHIWQCQMLLLWEREMFSSGKKCIGCWWWWWQTTMHLSSASNSSSIVMTFGRLETQHKSVTTFLCPHLNPKKSMLRCQNVCVYLSGKFAELNCPPISAQLWWKPEFCFLLHAMTHCYMTEIRSVTGWCNSSNTLWCLMFADKCARSSFR